MELDPELLLQEARENVEAAQSYRLELGQRLQGLQEAQRQVGGPGRGRARARGARAVGAEGAEGSSGGSVRKLRPGKERLGRLPRPRRAWEWEGGH